MSSRWSHWGSKICSGNVRRRLAVRGLEDKDDFQWELIDSRDTRAEDAYRKQWYLENRVIDEDPF
ncbi:hypothetical protein GCM10009735_86050 [Actinomadura chokoriensis]